MKKNIFNFFDKKPLAIKELSIFLKMLLEKIKNNL